MSGPVDVLSVLDQIAGFIGDPDWNPDAESDVAAARAAVAELILAAEETQTDAQTLGMDIPRLDAAIKRVRGAA